MQDETDFEAVNQELNIMLNDMSEHWKGILFTVRWGFWRRSSGWIKDEYWGGEKPAVGNEPEFRYHGHTCQFTAEQDWYVY